MNDIRERIARALWDREAERQMRFQGCPWDEAKEWYRDAMRGYADAVIAALGLREVHDGEGHYWQTPWERIEEDG